MKYFYSLGKFSHRASDPRFSHCGWDVRTWSLSTDVKEVSKEGFQRIQQDDKRIVQRMNDHYGILIKTWHNPHTTDF